MKKNIVITGANGFIGIALCRLLSKNRDNSVFAVVRENSQIDKLADLDLNIVKVDYSNPVSFSFLPDEIDVLYHLAGGGKVSSNSRRDFDILFADNLKVSEQLIAGLEFKKIKKICLASSVSAQGIHNNVVINENFHPKPLAPHEKVKFMVEEFFRLYCEERNIPLAILRPAQVYGPEDVKSEMKVLFKLVKKNFYPIFGNGENFMVPMIYIDDLCVFFKKAGRLNFKGIKYFTTIGNSCTVNEFVGILAKVVGTDHNGFHIPIILGYIGAFFAEILFKMIGKTPPISRSRIYNMSSNRLYNNSFTCEELDFLPQTELFDGLQRTYLWYLEKNSK